MLQMPDLLNIEDTARIDSFGKSVMLSIVELLKKNVYNSIRRA